MKTKTILFIWKNSKVQIIIVTLFIIIGIVVYLSQGIAFAAQWESWLEAFITSLILFMAVFIWYNEKRQDWKNSLRKKLNISYMLNNEVYCKVLNAPLAGKGDIRTWAISIGGTILNKKVHIDFSGFQISKPTIDYKKNNNVYGVTVYLKQPIEDITKGRVFRFDENGDLEKNQQSNQSTTD